MKRREESPHDQVRAPQSSASVFPHTKAAAGPRDDSVGFLVAQDKVDAAVNKSVDVQLEAEAASERAAQTERTASEIRQSKREMLEWMRNLERQVFGYAQNG
uniref:Uncharacterized protein n=1 Tax=Peronospora matthiolae TaxID=2874970 RepID=A0AAV1UFQ0_9STRA